MARKHRPDHRPLHPGRRLTAYPITAIADGPWPGRLALGPAPVGEGDPAAIAAWGAAAVLGLTTPEEAPHLGRRDLADHLAVAGLRWTNVPLDDFAAPNERFERVWPPIRDALLSQLAAGERLLVHCRGGRGRSGTVVAALLVAGGLSPDDAIDAVRTARPGAIETPEQEAWVRRLGTVPGATSR